MYLHRKTVNKNEITNVYWKKQHIREKAILADEKDIENLENGHGLFVFQLMRWILKQCWLYMTIADGLLNMSDDEQVCTYEKKIDT